jgi:ABC-2 type transport system permease protein
MRKYVRIFAYSVRNAVAYLRSFVFRNVFLIIVLFVFFSLWRVIYAGRELLAGFTLTQILWYLAFTEAVELSKTRVMNDVQEEVKDGTLAYTLQRPYSYVGYHLARSLGESVVKLGPILLLGSVTAFLFVGPLPGYFRSLPFGLVLMLGGIVLNSLWHLAIGLLAFWTEEVSPFYLILQKLIFIIGGMFFPIDLFPPWLQSVARVLPFAYSAYWPGRTMVRYSREAFLTGLVGQAGYIAVLAVVVAGLYALGTRRVAVQGG